jgi:hypothetical protein
MRAKAEDLCVDASVAGKYLCGRWYFGHVTGREEMSAERKRAGLCADCKHARRVESDRGAVFYLCGLSTTDARFPKYPALPVIRCAGYAPKD